MSDFQKNIEELYEQGEKGHKCSTYDSETIRGKTQSIFKNIHYINRLLKESIITRLKILEIEVDEFGSYIIKKACIVFMLVFFSMALIISLNIAIIIHYWDTYRNEAACGVVVFLLFIISVLTIFLLKTNKNPSLFPETIRQFQKDMENI